jgi:E3 ubiquitin-protein ligase BRE1
MASNILVEKAKEQNIQILQFQNQKLSEQLANLKNQISVLDGSVFKFEEQKKQYADTLLCVNRIWEQLIADVRSLCARCSSTSSSNQQADPAAAAAAATSSGSAPADTAVDDNAEDQGNGECEPWQRFDPFLRRLLSNCDAEAAAALKTIKRNSQDYQADLSEVEQALHARSAASLQVGCIRTTAAVLGRGSCC